LASFPRSGNTWVRFLVANVYNYLKGEFAEIDFFNVHDVVPELKKSGPADEPHYKDLPLLLKTHSRFQESFTNTILLVRNPFDVLYSYWNFLTANKELNMSLAEMARHETYGIAALVEHTNSYIRNCPNLLILQYENLKRRPAKEVRKICDFIGLSAGEDVIRSAVQQSSFSSMKKSENRKGRKFGQQDFQFVRRAKVGEGERVFLKDRELHRHLLKKMRRSPLLFLLYG
jgi:estrone sulfotransferase